nr:hypothetical protein [Synergistaceae bacterium]
MSRAIGGGVMEQAIMSIEILGDELLKRFLAFLGIAPNSVRTYPEI